MLILVVLRFFLSIDFCPQFIETLKSTLSSPSDEDTESSHVCMMCIWVKIEAENYHYSGVTVEAGNQWISPLTQTIREIIATGLLSVWK